MQSFNSSSNSAKCLTNVRELNITELGATERPTPRPGHRSDVATSLDAARRVREVQRAREEAVMAVEENELARQVQTLRRELAFHSDSALEEKLRLLVKMLPERPASYTRAIKLVSRYASTEEHRLSHVDKKDERTALAAMAVVQVESLMDRLPHSFSLGKDHPETPLKDCPNLDAIKRLHDLKNHLDARARVLDETRNNSLNTMASGHPILNEIVTRASAGSLPEDGTLIIMSAHGHYLAPRGSKSPHFIEVQRLLSGGVGADGAGFNRFAQDLSHISGAVIMRPIYDENGEPLQVPSKSQNGKPVLRKTVVDIIGRVPEGLETGIDFLQILRKFKPLD